MFSEIRLVFLFEVLKFTILFLDFSIVAFFFKCYSTGMLFINGFSFYQLYILYYMFFLVFYIRKALVLEIIYLNCHSKHIYNRRKCLYSVCANARKSLGLEGTYFTESLTENLFQNSETIFSFVDQTLIIKELQRKFEYQGMVGQHVMLQYPARTVLQPSLKLPNGFIVLS